jgi:threonylcarbamoyladenosine tRNA methylthiotransferase MtaB
MARRTSRAEFRELAAAARAAIPDLNLSTDLIAGFPGETETEFAETRRFVAEIGFSRLHVFTYSPRPGTAAARMPEQLPKQTRKARARELIDLGKELSYAFHQRYVGERRPVLWETAVGGNGDGLRWVGYTDNYIRVNAAGPSDLFNQITPVHLQEAHPDFVEGDILPEATA